MSGNSLVLESDISGTAEQLRYTNFRFLNRAYATSTGTYGFDHDFTVASTLIGGSITVDTQTEFVIFAGDTYPSQGQMVITFANDVKVHITAVDNATYSIEYDLDGDGIYESGVTTHAWSTL